MDTYKLCFTTLLRVVFLFIESFLIQQKKKIMEAQYYIKCLTELLVFDCI